MNAEGIWPILLAVAPLFAALPLALLLGNVLVRLVPPARRALDAEAQAYPHASFRASQAQLRKAAFVAVPLAFLATLLAASLMW
jgi:hypothetical protein